jgi:S1-C subfamily serine protease
MKFLKFCVACAIALGASTIYADDQAIEATGRKILDAYANSIVVVNAVIKVTIFNDAQAKVGEQEKKNEVVGTFIDPSGLVICSLAAIDPTTTVTSIRANVDGQPQKLTVKGELSDIKFRLSSGDEVDAKVVLKDEDQDLAFLAPKKPLEAAAASKITAVNLADNDKNVQIMDSVLFISRLGKNFGYEPAVISARITSKISKPRVEFLAGGQPGLPAFSREGKLLGVVLTHHRPETEAASGTEVVQTAVLIPASDLIDGAKQALEELKKTDVKKADK